MRTTLLVLFISCFSPYLARGDTDIFPANCPNPIPGLGDWEVVSKSRIEFRISEEVVSYLGLDIEYAYYRNPAEPRQWFALKQFREYSRKVELHPCATQRWFATSMPVLMELLLLPQKKSLQSNPNKLLQPKFRKNLLSSPPNYRQNQQLFPNLPWPNSKQ